MGYTTDFYGEFTVTPTLSPEHAAYLRAFATTRRMKRDPKITETFSDPLREAVGLPVGPEGAYYVGDPEPFGQSHTPDIVDYNTAPGAINSGPFYRDAEGNFSADGAYERWTVAQEMAVAEGAQPGLWCQWTPNEDGTAIVWDEGEKFYEYEQWLRYLIEHFLEPWGYALNGEVEWRGEDPDDRGALAVTDNALRVGIAQTTFVYGAEQ